MLSFAGADKPPLNPHFEPLQPLLGKTWKGVFKDSKPDKPVIDVSHWERALNGQAVRSLHSINQGMYGGETVFIWNDKKKTIEYYYFTTAGFMTTGTLEIKEGKFISHEEVKGEAGGITEVRSTCEIQPDGKWFKLRKVAAFTASNDEHTVVVWAYWHHVDLCACPHE